MEHDFIRKLSELTQFYQDSGMTQSEWEDEIQQIMLGVIKIFDVVKEFDNPEETMFSVSLMASLCENFLTGALEE